MVRLSKRLIDETPPDPERDRFLWDDETPGFGVRIRSSGRKVYILQYRYQGKTRRLTLGRHGVLTPDQARRLAVQHLAELYKGRDPRADRDRQVYPTIKAFAVQFIAEYLPELRPNTARDYRRMLEDLIVPALGNKTLDTVTRADVARLHHSLRETPTQANRVLSVLSRLFAVAGKWGYAPEGHNPARGHERFPERKRLRFLSPSELARLGEVLREHEPIAPAQVLAVKLLLLTGCRLNEILTLKWEQVDFERGVLTLREAKTGPRDVVLGRPALELLREAYAERTSEWVIPGRVPDRHLVNLSDFWGRVRKQAGVPDVRLHDLRHSHASVGVSRGLSLRLVGELLGHRQAETTMRYAHLAVDPVKQAADLVAGEIERALEGARDGEGRDDSG